MTLQQVSGKVPAVDVVVIVVIIAVRELQESFSTRISWIICDLWHEINQFPAGRRTTAGYVKVEVPSRTAVIQKSTTNLILRLKQNLE